MPFIITWVLRDLLWRKVGFINHSSNTNYWDEDNCWSLRSFLLKLEHAYVELCNLVGSSLSFAIHSSHYFIIASFLLVFSFLPSCFLWFPIWTGKQTSASWRGLVFKLYKIGTETKTMEEKFRIEWRFKRQWKQFPWNIWFYCIIKTLMWYFTISFHRFFLNIIT